MATPKRASGLASLAHPGSLRGVSLGEKIAEVFRSLVYHVRAFFTGH